jgi:hypothetical protein
LIWGLTEIKKEVRKTKAAKLSEDSRILGEKRRQFNNWAGKQKPPSHWTI